MTVSLTCPICHTTSHSLDDYRNGYCGRCHDFTANVPVTDWTDEEWVRTLKEFPPGTDSMIAGAAVWRWRNDTQKDEQ